MSVALLPLSAVPRASRGCAPGRGLAAPALALVAALLTASCGADPPRPPRRPTRDLGHLSFEAELPADPVPQLGPIAMELTWRPGDDFVAPDGDLMLFIQFLDSEGRIVFSDDHLPPRPVAEWRAGEPVAYRRVVMAPWSARPDRYEARAGFYRPRTQDMRFVFTPASGEQVDHVGLGDLDIAPRDPAHEPLYISGWHPLEVEAGGQWGTWRWTRGDATMEFLDVSGTHALHLWLQAPDATPQNPQPLEIEADGRELARRTAVAAAPFHWQVDLPVGCAPDCSSTVVLRVGRLLDDSRRGGDPRQLGVKVLSVYLER